MVFYLCTTLAGAVSVYLSFQSGYYTDSVGVFVFTLAICLTLSSLRQLLRTSYHTYSDFSDERRVQRQLKRMIEREHSFKAIYEDKEASSPSLAFQSAEPHDK
ncbi:hypothetical protein [Exiguobacterium flavidum]|uniref:hypothetical protein n=1 Tax=Exiguobacterium flavidum TaxID=2184695 RepID=UPI000DF7874F|nr:hypothetical protein [Exiguobacterium flavidum]